MKNETIAYSLEIFNINSSPQEKGHQSLQYLCEHLINFLCKQIDAQGFTTKTFNVYQTFRFSEEIYVSCWSVPKIFR